MRNRRGSARASGHIPGMRDAVILVDKPEGRTSYETVSEVRRLTGAAKAGHSGTLDRFASGLLVVCTGRYTRLTRFLLEEDKCYTGTVRLGIVTDTDDREGAVIGGGPAESVPTDDILSCAARLTGELMQVPPRYSALKIRGRRASDRARNGEEVELKERRVAVHEFNVFDHDRPGARFSFLIRCTKGTYVRSLARDIGEMLGTGAHLESLRRTESGRFRVDDAATLEDISSYAAGRPVEGGCVIRPAEALRECGRIRVDDRGRGLVLNGGVFPPESALDIEVGAGKTFIILDEKENLIAIAEADIQKWHVRYINVFNPSVDRT